MPISSSYHAQVLCAECVAKRISLPCPISSVSVCECVSLCVYVTSTVSLFVVCVFALCLMPGLRLPHIATHSLCACSFEFETDEPNVASRQIQQTTYMHHPPHDCDPLRMCVCRSGSVEHSPIPSIAMTIFLRFYCLPLALAGREITLFVHYIKYESVTLTHFA